MPSIFCSDLTYDQPDGDQVLRGVDLRLGPGRTGLIGANGAGKTTLLRLIAGDLRPTGGAVHTDGVVGYLPQDMVLRVERAVDDVLGIADVRAAVRRVESGRVTADDLTTIGEDWDVDERARAILDRLGLHHLDLDRAVGTLSGGESILVALAARFLRRPDILVLDEPTNNLDLDHRQRLYDAIADYRGVLVVVSHDRTLLGGMDRIAELRDRTVRVHTGNLGVYQETVAREQETARRLVHTAEADLRRQRGELIDASIAIDRRRRTGHKQAAQNRYPKVVAQQRKRQAEVSAARLRDVQTDRVTRAEQDVARARAALRDDDEIRVSLPETAVASRRRVLTCEGVNIAPDPDREQDLLWSHDLDLTVRGPERVALMGPNGAGKTTLLRLIVGQHHPTTGTVTTAVTTRIVPQRLDVLDDDADLLANVRRVAPRATDNEIRAGLARLLLRGPTVGQRAGTLSGGERFRAVVAALLTAPPPPGLLLLDEPTNNLDLASIDQLVAALRGYEGALLVASHDLSFLEAIGVTNWLRLDRRDGLRDVAPPGR